MTDKPTFMRLKNVPKPLQSPRTRAEEEKGICLACGKDIKNGISAHRGICAAAVNRGGVFERGTMRLSPATLETIKSIYERHGKS